MSRSPSMRAGSVSATLASHRLGVAPVVLFVLSAATPLTVVAGVMPTGIGVTGLTGLPIAFAAIGVVLLPFAVGFTTMARHIVNAGAFYTYIARGLGRIPGVGAAWLALLAYNALQVGLYGAFGAQVAALYMLWFGHTVPWWLPATAAVLLVAALGLRSVGDNGRVLAVLLIAEVTIIVVLSAANLTHPAPGPILAPISPTNLLDPNAGALLSMGVLGYVGFEQAVVFAEEVRDPLRTVPRATYAAVAVIAALYILASWGLIAGVGADRIVPQAAAQGPELLFGLAAQHLGPVAVAVTRALMVTSLFAAQVSFHNVVARYAFALGREGVLPRALGRTSHRTGAPRNGSLLQTAIAAGVLLIYGIGGWDPMVHLFFWAGTTGAVGVLLLMATTAIAVIVFFARDRHGETLWRRAIAPALAAIALTGICALALTNLPTLLGVAPGSTVTRLVPVIFLTTAVLGALWALLLKATNPTVYHGIGYGARTALLLPNQGRFTTPAVR